MDEVIIEGRREIGEGTFEYVASGAIEGRKSLIDNDVSSENAQYSNEDDVLYFSENSVLLRYPPRKKMPRFEHPTKTNGIGAFKPCRSVEQIDLKTNEAFECVDNTFEQTDVETIDVRDRFVDGKTICGICI